MEIEGSNSTTQATETAVEALDPWFHYSDDFANAIMPKDGCGKALAVSTEIAKDDATESYYKRYIFRHANDKHCCIVCGELKSVKDNSISNLVAHIKAQHYDKVVLLKKHVPDHFKQQKKKRMDGCTK